MPNEFKVGCLIVLKNKKQWKISDGEWFALVIDELTAARLYSIRDNKDLEE